FTVFLIGSYPVLEILMDQQGFRTCPCFGYRPSPVDIQQTDGDIQILMDPFTEIVTDSGKVGDGLRRGEVPLCFGYIVYGEDASIPTSSQRSDLGVTSIFDAVFAAIGLTQSPRPVGLGAQ